ncbi:hypothetical protein [Aliivibrio kagoshimensis]|uniref:hypothetical protein n=1 Tax=Aliivibrio kagoshimensis TaxID=2910230 RepID=UPI003D0FB6FC
MEHCYRCKLELTETTPAESGNILFYACEGCGACYAKKAGQQLHDRWQMPITIPLYSLIYEKEPLKIVNNVVNQISRSKRRFVEPIINDIHEELNNPKQKLIEIHDYLYPDEQQFREFLRLVATGLQDRLDNPRPKPPAKQKQSTSSFLYRLLSLFK